MIDRATFYARLRRSGLFGPYLDDNEVRGTEGILNAFRIYGDGRLKTLAYVLATAYHETGGHMVPVREGFAKSDHVARQRVEALARRRGPNSAVARYAKPTGPHGHVYYGRGHVQLTWFTNYARTGALIGKDLVADPDLMLDPLISARVMIEGMLDGRWNARNTGLAHYLPDNGPDDLMGARRCVNLTDKWRTIAGYYRVFLAALEAAQKTGA